MKHYRTLGFILATQLLWVSAVFAQGNYKTEPTGALTAADVPKALEDLLDSQGTKMVNDQGAVLCEVWLRKTVPTSSSPSSSSDILYGALGEGALLGVLHFPNPAADFRGQAIKPGYYTLRYGLIPQDGNHMGVNPYRDVTLLAPATADKDLDKNLKFDDLVKLARQASGTPHPGFLVMAQASGDAFPSAVKDDQGHWNLQLKLHGSNGDVPVAVTVVGKWEG